MLAALPILIFVINGLKLNHFNVCMSYGIVAREIFAYQRSEKIAIVGLKNGKKVVQVSDTGGKPLASYNLEDSEQVIGIDAQDNLLVKKVPVKNKTAYIQTGEWQKKISILARRFSGTYRSIRYNHGTR